MISHLCCLKTYPRKYNFDLLLKAESKARLAKMRLNNRSHRPEQDRKCAIGTAQQQSVLPTRATINYDAESNEYRKNDDENLYLVELEIHRLANDPSNKNSKR